MKMKTFAGKIFSKKNQESIFKAIQFFQYPQFYNTKLTKIRMILNHQNDNVILN